MPQPLHCSALSFLGSVVVPLVLGELALHGATAMDHVLHPCLGVLSCLITREFRAMCLCLDASMLLADHLANVNVITDQSLDSCKPGHVAATRNPFAPFPLFNPKALFSYSAETVCLQSPFAARVLRRLAAALSISHWDFAAGLCDYGGSGVHCDCSFSNGTICHVTEIFLNKQNFSGELPPDFADFPNLLQLDLSRNLFHGGVPDQWARMKLQGLSIEGNEFHGPIPPEIGGLIRMEKLILSANEFTGPLPTALSLFSNLTDLRISSTNFSGRMPDFCGKLKRLEKLQIEGSLLEGPLPLSLSELANLSI